MLLLADSVLHPWMVDFATVFGVVGTIATLIGLALTWVQVRGAKKAAEAARDAALATAERARHEYVRFVISTCHRFVSEIKIYVQAEKYEAAAFRSADIAGQLILLRVANPELGDNFLDKIERLREWEQTFQQAAGAGQGLSKNSRAKWGPFHHSLASAIDNLHGPFAATEGGE
ncbi:MAG: hypothetical protein SFV23_17445 [Planctomycetaceae bacterium]|nr:hypothetical protein [Planctomycetaceae bacterium]